MFAFIENCFFWSVISWYLVWTVFLNNLAFKPTFQSTIAEWSCVQWLTMDGYRRTYSLWHQRVYLLLLKHVRLSYRCAGIVCLQGCSGIYPLVRSPDNETNKLHLSHISELKKQIYEWRSCWRISLVCFFRSSIFIQNWEK